MSYKLTIIALIFFIPLSVSAIPISYSFDNSKIYFKKNKKRSSDLNGSITGEWDGSVLSGITGSLLSNDGKVSIKINGGTLNSNGGGSWMLDITKNYRTYTGTINFKNLPSFNITDTNLNIWGGSSLSCTKSNGKSCSGKWFGLGAKGSGSNVPGPAPFVVMGIGLVGFIIASKVRQKTVN